MFSFLSPSISSSHLLCESFPTFSNSLIFKSLALILSSSYSLSFSRSLKSSITLFIVEICLIISALAFESSSLSALISLSSLFSFWKSFKVCSLWFSMLAIILSLFAICSLWSSTYLAVVLFNLSARSFAYFT